MSVVRRTITAGTFVVLLAFLLPSTSSADVDVPIHPMSDDDLPFDIGDNDDDDDDAAYAASGAFAGQGGAGTFEVAAATEDDDAAYAADGAFAGQGGAGTFDVAAATEDDDAAYAADGAFAGHDGAGTFEVAAATHDDDDTVDADEVANVGFDTDVTPLTDDADTMNPVAPVKEIVPVHMPLEQNDILDSPVSDSTASYESSSVAGPNGAATHTAASVVDEDEDLELDEDDDDADAWSYVQGSTAGIGGAATYHASSVSHD
jgi:hypothetical protein